MDKINTKLINDIAKRANEFILNMTENEGLSLSDNLYKAQREAIYTSVVGVLWKYVIMAACETSPDMACNLLEICHSDIKKEILKFSKNRTGDACKTV